MQCKVIQTHNNEASVHTTEKETADAKLRTVKEKDKSTLLPAEVCKLEL